MAILFLAAEYRELRYWRRHCASRHRLDWPVDFSEAATWRDREVLLAANGAGPALAAEAARIAYRESSLEAVVSVGFCGALDPPLTPGAIFVATEILTGSGSFRVQDPKPAVPCSRGALYSIDRIVGTVEERRHFRSLGASAVEMEAAGLVHLVREWGVPFFCVRSVTDAADEGFNIDYNAARRPGGRLRMSWIVASALIHPFANLPELIRLGWRSRAAARSLGDFLAHCRF